MKLACTASLGGLALIGAAVSPLALADEPGWYGGLSVGQSRSRIDNARMAASVLPAGVATQSISEDDRDTGYKIFGGYRVNRNFAIEGGFFDLGKFGFVATTTPPGTLGGNIKLKGVNLDAVGFLPITERFSAFARAGLNHAEARDSFVGTGAATVNNPNPRKRDTNLKYGVGLQYAFNDALAVRLEAERYRINDAVGNKGDVDLISVGLLYTFGRKGQAAAPRAAAPEPAAAVEPRRAEPMAPIAAAPQPAPAYAPLAKVAFSADSLFEFDKSSMTTAGKQAVDRFASELASMNYEFATVTGHTDRLGTHQYNLELSMRRAEAVKAYLTESAGIPGYKVRTLGVDGAEPVTKPGECVGTVATAELIACLQPDRRVEIEVMGTR